MRNLLVVAAAAAALACVRAPAQERSGLLEVFADASADAHAADGSLSHPFTTLSAALAAAGDGAVVRFAPGDYPGGLAVDRPLVLVGPGPARARLLFRGDAGVLVRAPAELSGFTVEGGRVGVRIEGGTGHVLRNLSFRGQAEAGVRADGAGLRVEGCEFVALDPSAAHGLYAVGGRLEAHANFFRDAGRRTLHFEGASGTAAANDIEGAGLVGIAATGGADVIASGNRIARCGGAAIFAVRSTLHASGNDLTQSEYGLLTGQETVIFAADNTIGPHREAGIALVATRGELRHNRVTEGGHRGGISVTGGAALILIADNTLASPGPVGIHVNGSNVQLRDNRVEGARAERDGDFGHGIYALESRVDASGNLLVGNAGAGLVLANSAGTLRDNRSRGNAREGALLLHRARFQLFGNQFDGNGEAGLQVSDGARARLSGNRFRANGGWGVRADCRSGGRATLEEGNLFELNASGASLLCP